ncbi:SH3 domain-binding glutamic acid-rich protein homolog [Centruroides vittatus]|uniref:SH3 domain-binding glutamic acid-rich protein homolog n=1 Tax=Centruroides vittatus TaxID=120091 RepID=UPI00350F6300
MAIKVYISGVCGSQEVRKRQQRVLFVLTSMKIDYEVVDVTEPGRDEDKEFMKEECKKHNKENVLPPQIFNDNEYCGDYSDFEVANDDDKLLVFLKMQDESAANETTVNGNKEEINENEENVNEKETVDVSYNETNGTVEETREEEKETEASEPKEEKETAENEEKESDENEEEEDEDD